MEGEVSIRMGAGRLFRGVAGSGWRGRRKASEREYFDRGDSNGISDRREFMYANVGVG